MPSGAHRRLQAGVPLRCLVRPLSAHTPQTKFYVSGSDREGEGEFKIFEHLARLPSPPEGARRERVLVIGKYGHPSLTRSHAHAHAASTQLRIAFYIFSPRSVTLTSSSLR